MSESCTLPIAVLRHELPDGTHHFDWLLAERPGQDPERRDLITFRCSSPPDGLPEGVSIELERLPNHRRHYLTHEGPISDGRGEVARIAEGLVRWLVEGESVLVAHIRWCSGAAPQTIRLERLADDHWQGTVIPGDGEIPPEASPVA